MGDVPIKGLESWACEWEDAHQSSLEYERGDIVHRPMHYVTTGILLKDDEAGMTFATDACETNTFRGTNFIPRKMIVRAWRIGQLEPRKSRKKVDEAQP